MCVLSLRENEWGNWGKRPAAHVYQLFNQHLRGRMVTVATDDVSKVEIFAVAAGPRRALALINRSGAAQQVTLNCSGWHSVPTQFTAWQVTASGLAQSAVPYATLTSAYTLPQDSVTVLETTDLGVIRDQFGRRSGDAGFDRETDLSQDGQIDAVDLRAALP